jgi:NitT/TauT family transport system permease protein
MSPLIPWLLRSSGLALFVFAWHLAIAFGGGALLPGPVAVGRAIGELAASGELVRHVVASLFRVTWGYLAAVAAAIPLGLALGRSPRFGGAMTPLLELARPISPLAWIPLAILWLGVGDLSAVFIIFVGAFLPLVLAARSASRSVPDIHLRAGRNFGLSPAALAWRIVLPAALPQLLAALRLALGIAWLVVVAAEMIAVNSGLGFLIVDARNAGDRYDLVVAGMVLIGAVGITLDALLRRLERSGALRWAYTAATLRAAPRMARG